MLKLNYYGLALQIVKEGKYEVGWPFFKLRLFNRIRVMVITQYIKSIDIAKKIKDPPKSSSKIAKPIEIPVAGKKIIKKVSKEFNAFAASSRNVNEFSLLRYTIGNRKGKKRALRIFFTSSSFTISSFLICRFLRYLGDRNNQT